MELEVGVQNYDWGKRGKESVVAQLYKEHSSTVAIESNIPYAELWMGTHVNCPSKIKSTKMYLSCILQNHPKYLGEDSVKQFGQNLPFLFKVLSIQKALSIQAHPNIELAKTLHAARPEIYKDPNHKPELAIALTDFKAMCGFRPFKEIQSNFQAVSELKPLIGEDIYTAFIIAKGNEIELLSQVFQKLMTSTPEAIEETLGVLLAKIKKNPKGSNKQLAEINQLILKLHDQFPNDVGCFGPLFFNILNLKPGEAIYLGANEPHAYIEGDCVECMASSDNVVRAGLTPKYKDVETLCAMLNYRGASAEDTIFKPVVEDEYTSIFRPPVPDFAVAAINVPKDQNMALIKRSVASIIIFIRGYAHTQDDVVCKSGTILFLPANEELRLVDVSQDIICYQGMANVN